MNPSRSPLQKYHLASCFCEKVKRLRGFFCAARGQGSERSGRRSLETSVKLKASRLWDTSQLKSKVLKMQKSRFLKQCLTRCHPWPRHHLTTLFEWRWISGCHKPFGTDVPDLTQIFLQRFSCGNSRTWMFDFEITQQKTLHTLPLKPVYRMYPFLQTMGILSYLPLIQYLKLLN